MAFFGLLKKKQSKFEESIMENTDTKRESAAPAQPSAQQMKIQTGSIPVQMKTFDILVFELDDNGRKTQKVVNGVKGFSAQDLVSLYAAEGNQIRILKEYPSEGAPMPPQPPQLIQTPPPPQPQLAKIAPMGVPAQPSTPVQQTKEPPKYFEIGGVKCKLENGKMYQEQWMKVDSSKYRLIADATNKLVSMNGKHLEMLKWVQIDDAEDEQNG